MRKFTEHFPVLNPQGQEQHTCFVYEPVRETLRHLPGRFEGNALPLPFIKAYTSTLLKGRGYLHSECKVVHAGQPLSVSFLENRK